MRGLAESELAGVCVTRTDGDQGSRVLEAWNLGGHLPVRVTTAFKRLLRLDDINVVAVEFLAHLIVSGGG